MDSNLLEHHVTEHSTIGAGNAFLGGLGAGLRFTQDVCEGIPGLEGGPTLTLTCSTAVFYASVSASFIIEQEGLPLMEADGGLRKWNEDSPQRRLSELRHRAGL